MTTYLIKKATHIRAAFIFGINITNATVRPLIHDYHYNAVAAQIC